MKLNDFIKILGDVLSKSAHIDCIYIYYTTEEFVDSTTADSTRASIVEEIDDSGTRGILRIDNIAFLDATTEDMSFMCTTRGYQPLKSSYPAFDAGVSVYATSLCVSGNVPELDRLLDYKAVDPMIIKGAGADLTIVRSITIGE